MKFDKYFLPTTTKWPYRFVHCSFFASSSLLFCFLFKLFFLVIIQSSVLLYVSLHNQAERSDQQLTVKLPLLEPTTGIGWSWTITENALLECSRWSFVSPVTITEHFQHPTSNIEHSTMLVAFQPRTGKFVAQFASQTNLQHSTNLDKVQRKAFNKIIVRWNLNILQICHRFAYNLFI